jgi:putative ABC transport system ATP-binding protein
MKPVIDIKAINKIYDTGAIQLHALKDADLLVEQGEFLAIMGPSGSGKSTLMNLISCMDKPTSGKYLLNGEDVSKYTLDQLAEVRNKRIGMVFQSFNLLSRTSALENVQLPLLYDGTSDFKRRHDVAMATLEEVGLKDWWHHYPNQLSGGQQQRVAIARAIVNNPMLILADEPTGNLDSKTSIEIMELLQELNEERNKTIIIVTHETDIARYAKRIITLVDGRIIKEEKVKNRLSAKEELKNGRIKKRKAAS